MTTALNLSFHAWSYQLLKLSHLLRFLRCATSQLRLVVTSQQTHTKLRQFKLTQVDKKIKS